MNDSKNVLIVDDSKSARSFLREIVVSLGHVALEAAHGREGLELLERQAPDLILTDLEMPEMNGQTFMGELMKRCPHIPVVVISVKSSYGDVIEAIRRGAWDYLVKPVGRRDLKRVINNSLERARLLDENFRYRRELEEQVREQTRELQRSRERYRRLLESVTSYVYSVVFSPDGSVETVHRPGCEKVTGYTVDEYQTDHELWYRIVFEEDRLQVLAMSRRILTESAAVCMEHRIFHKDGSLRWIRNTLVPCRDGEGRLLSYDGIIADITERKRAEEALLRITLEWERTFDSVPDQIAIIDSRHRIVRANRATARRGGMTPDDCIGQPCYRILHASDQPHPSCPHLMTLRDGQEHVTEFHDVRSGCYQLVSTTPLPDESGLTGTVHVVRDISDIKLADSRLRQSELKFKTVFESRQEGLLLADIATGDFRLSNRAMSSMLGYSADEFGLMNIRDIHPPNELPMVLELFERQTRGEQEIAVEIPVRRRDGSIFYADICTTIVNLDDGTYLLGSFRDVTERRAAQEKLKHHMDNLTTLRTIDNVINGSLDLGITLKVLLAESLSRLKVDAALVLLLDPCTQTLEYGAGQGFRTIGIQQARIRIGEGCSGRVAKERRTLVLGDLSFAVEGSLLKALVESEGISSYVGVPLIAKGVVKGVLGLYHRGPLDPDRDWLNFTEALAGQAAIAIDNAELYESLQSSNSELLSAYDATIEGWSRALDYRDRETEGHSRRVTDLTLRMAREMGMDNEKLIHVRRGALLHDIGKLGVPDSILLKPGALSDEEFAVMKRHPEIAYRLLSPIEFLRPALDIPHFHHERWDGRGYPLGLRGEEIPLTARIFAIVDVWDALRSDRPYRAAWPLERVREHMGRQSGTAFDPALLELFLDIYSRETE